MSWGEALANNSDIAVVYYSKAQIIHAVSSSALVSRPDAGPGGVIVRKTGHSEINADI